MTEQELIVLKRFYKKRAPIIEILTTFVDKAEEALLEGEGIEDALEFIGLKSDELLMQL
ncbi:hypothetical protein [Mammaliicoccus sp. P-M59]|uniref:hypothetical protein n=1 Tax=Mammaliicoccus sp. P-M59 TaxID=2898718 RepID=UPI001EFBB5BD|nr:hypothetical protein [Mammaliicoccus sp. P-M59]